MAVQIAAVPRSALAADTPWQEYRDKRSGMLVLYVIGDLASDLAAAACVVFAPGPDRTTIDEAAALAFSADFLPYGVWPCALDADGNVIAPALEADPSALAAQVRAVWPAYWRVRLATDPEPVDTFTLPPPPTGPLKVGVLLE